MGGGQATNAGINYQQRIAAWCLILQYSKLNISDFFDQIESDGTIEKTIFESDSPVDDLILECKDGKRVFFQIKRALSLSKSNSSELFKTIFQFVGEFLKDEESLNLFGLITTNDSSRKITNDLKKLGNAIRLNDLAFSDNPLNDSEKDSLEKIEIVFKNCYLNKTGNHPSSTQFYNFLSRLIIEVIDIESNQTIEKAAMMLLKSLGFKNPGLIWAILIKNSLVYATNRYSVTQKSLEKILNKYLIIDGEEPRGDFIIDGLKTETIIRGEIPVGREVLIIESFMDDFDYMIVELHRFTDSCSFKNRYYSNKIDIRGKKEWTIIQRFATFSGFERYVEENQDHFTGKRICIINAKDTESVEESECCSLHRSHLEELLANNPNPLLCLHCGKKVNHSGATEVEVQDDESTPGIGLVHKRCLRPIDRIIGVTQTENIDTNYYVENFDFKLWVRLLLRGQGLLNSMRNNPSIFQGRSPMIAWSDDEEYDADYSYCIKFSLEDGSSHFAHQRMKIARLNKLEAEHQKIIFKKSLEEKRAQKDPNCILSVSRLYGPYSEILRAKSPDEEILEIIDVEVARYSKLVAQTFDRDIQYYTPICLVRDIETESTLRIGNIVPLISDPLAFESFLSNWEKAGLEFGPMELKIIKSDRDFDYHMRSIFGDGLVPIVDPYFSLKWELVSGYPIEDINRLMQEKEMENAFEEE